jgi:eukaryotic-like serine/threonine-protein kinase
MDKRGSKLSRFARHLVKTRLLDASEVAAAQQIAGEDDDELARHLIRQGLITRFQVRQLRAGATKFHVDKYVVVDCLGRGGCSVVYKARHEMMPHRYVALKTLDGHDVHNGDEVLARFRREIEIVTRLNHPNIVGAYDVICTRTQLYLVLEYVEGCDLGTLVKKRSKLPVEEAVDYIVQAARGLAYAHKQGIVHRDLKPGNLLLTQDGVVKIADLGLARFYGNKEADHEDDGLRVQGACLGTPEFMSPEQAEDPSKVGPRSDLYSLGATLFHLLSGELPITGTTMIHRLQRLLMTPPRPLMFACPDAPGGLAVIVDRLRARNPLHRPATAEEVIQLLQPFAPKAPEAAPVVWDGARKVELVLEVLRGNLTSVEACRRHGIALEEFEKWRHAFLEGGRRAFEADAATHTQPDLHVIDLHARIGAQAREIEGQWKQAGGRNGANGKAENH